MRRAEQRAAGLALIGATCAMALLAAAPAWTQVLCAIGLVAIASGSWRAGWIGSSHRLTDVCWHFDGRWLLAEGCGRAFPGQLSAATRVLPGVLWLRWRTGTRQSRSMLLTTGDLPAGQLRALIVRLRIETLERALPEFHKR